MITALTPSAARRTISAGSLTVQTLRSTPSSWARTATAGAKSSPSAARYGCRAECPWSWAMSRATRGSGSTTTRYPVGTRGSSALDPVDRREVERRDQDRVVQIPGLHQLHHRGGGPVGGVEIGVVRGVLDLDVHEHPGAEVEHFGQARDLGSGGRDLGPGVVGEQPEPGDGRIVVDDERVVGTAMDVELHPVRALFPGRGERGERVLDRGPRCPAMTEHEGARIPGEHAGRLRSGFVHHESAGQTPCNTF